MAFKKYNMFLWVIMVAGTLQAMDLPSQAIDKGQGDANIVPITAPYKPKFSVRHPNITNAARSLAVGGAVAGLGLAGSKAARGDIGREEVVASGILGTIAAIGNYLYNLFYPKPVSTIDSLLTNPLELSKASQSMGDELNKFTEEHKRYSQKEYQDYFDSPSVQEMMSKNPISLLAECEMGGRCTFDRSSGTGYREKFAEYVAAGMINQIRAKNKQTVNYTSFGSGGGLQDMIILTKVLAQEPDANLNIHLIDRQNRIFVGALDYFKVKRQIDIEQPELDFFGSTFNEYVQSIKDKDKPKLTDEDLKAQLTTNCLQRQKQYKQFITFLKKTFPSAHISLFIHESTESYLAYLDKETLNYPDVVVAADIQDEPSSWFQARFNYAKLCQKSLEKKPEGFNAWLVKLRHENIGIISLSLVFSEGAKEERFQVGYPSEDYTTMEYEGEIITLYTSIVKLN